MVLKLRTLQKVDQKYLESFEMWCWRRMEKISWTDCVRNEEVLHRVKDRNIIYTIKRRKANWIGHRLCKNCFLNVTGGKTEGTRRGRRTQLLDDLGEKVLEFESGSSSLHRVENLIWKRLWSCCRQTRKRMFI